MPIVGGGGIKTERKWLSNAVVCYSVRMYHSVRAVSVNVHVTGAQGPRGPAGPQGATGADGGTGPPGATGPQGSLGNLLL